MVATALHVLHIAYCFVFNPDAIQLSSTSVIIGSAFQVVLVVALIWLARSVRRGRLMRLAVGILAWLTAGWTIVPLVIFGEAWFDLPRIQQALQLLLWISLVIALCLNIVALASGRSRR